MYNTVLLSSVGLSALLVIYVFLTSRGVANAPIGSKRMADADKPISKSAWERYSKGVTGLALASIVLFTLLMYLFGWQVAVSYLLSAALFGLVDFFALEFSDKANVRVAEASRSSIQETISLAFRTAAASGILAISSVVIVSALAVFAFSGLDALYAVALAAVVASVFSWQKISTVSAVSVAVVAAVIAGSEFLPSTKNAPIFPLAVLAAGTLMSIITSWFFKLKEGGKLSLLFAKRLVISCAVVIAGSYFLIDYLLADNGFATLTLFLLFSSGVLACIISILLFRKEKMLPVVLAGVIAVCANHFAGFYGISIALVGAIATSLLAIVLDPLREVGENAAQISSFAELPEESGERTKILAKSGLSTTNYLSLLTILVSLVLVLVFAKSLPTLGSKISDPKVFAGLLFGGALVYFLGLKQLSQGVHQIAVTVLSVAAAGVLMGSTFLAGLIVGVIAANLFSTENGNAKTVLLVVLTSLLTSSFISELYTLNVRLIISGSIILLGALIVVWQNYSESIVRIFSDKIKNEPGV